MVINGLFVSVIWAIVSRLRLDAIDFNFIVPAVISILAAALINWIYFGTYYQLTVNELKYSSGPFKGTIKIKDIKEVIVGKSMWVGLKPATATKGLIVKFNSYDEIYILPETNELFVKKLLEMNPAIVINPS